MNTKGSIFFHFSNDLTALFNLFSKRVQQGSPFEQKKIVTPSLAVKNSLKSLIAKSLGICMGFDFLSMQPLIHELIGHFFPEVQIDSHLDLALKIEKEIKKILTQGPSRVFAPLLNYLEDDKKGFDFKKLTTISDHLASLFVTYALYVPNLKEEFQAKEIDCWQKELWNLVFAPNSYYYDPASVLSLKPKVCKEPFSLFIFNVSFLPKPYYYFLKHISSQIQVDFFQLSLCSNYSVDIQSDFEKSVYLKRLKQKGISKGEMENLEGYLSNRNALLANCGKLNREFLKVIEDDELFLPSESFLASDVILNIPSYEKWVDRSKFQFDKAPLSLLSALKTDLLLLFSQNETLDFKEDSSLEIHSASTIQREVDVLYDNIIKYLAENKSLNPRDIAVYIPQIENYIPYLKAKFKNQENGIEISIFNAPFKISNSPLKGFYLLLDLANNLDPEKFLELLHLPAFKNRFGLNYETLKNWKSWIEEVGVTFGFDENDQKMRLLSKYQHLDFENTGQPSFDDLIQSLIKYLCQKHVSHEMIPSLSGIDFSASESINLLIEILLSLKSDLIFLKESKLSLSLWASYAECLLESYFDFDKNELNKSSKIFERIEFYRTHLSNNDQDLFSFETFYYYLKKDLDDLEKDESIPLSQSIPIYSLSNSPSIDSKVVYIMGLNDLEFPRPKSENPLCLLKYFSEKDYRPLSMDYDRYLFLEMIGAAKEKLFLSYLGYSTETFKEVGPSILISELLSYLDKRFLINGAKPSEKVVYKHPHLSFSKKYFEKENYHFKDFSLAKSYYGHPCLSKSEVLSNFLKANRVSSPITLSNKERVLNINYLSQLARNSIQFSLNKGYEVYLERESLSHVNQNFSLSSLQRSIMRKKLILGKSIPDIEGLPKGIFREIENQRFNQELAETLSFLNESGISKQDLFSVELRTDIKKIEKVSEAHWVAPSLKVDLDYLNEIELVGVIENISCKGVVSHRMLNEESLFIEWPKYLIYMSLKENFPLELKPQILFIKSKKIKTLGLESTSEYLKEFLHLYFLSLKSILPFLPKWIPYFMKFSPDEIAIRIQKDLESPHFYNKYTKGLFLQGMPANSTVALWKTLALGLFKKTYEVLSS